MKVDVYFDCAAVFDVSEFQVVKGETFSLISDISGTWFSDNDPVLSVVQASGEMSATITAAETGKSTLLSMPAGSFNNQKVLTITVVDSITQPAVSLGVTAEEIEPK